MTINTIKSPAHWAPHNALSQPKGLATQPKDFDWLRKNIPCQAACPAGTDIPGYLEAISQGEHDEAYRINLRDNVFPAVLGRVCTRPCEPACRHGWEGLGDSVAICFSKRSAADFASKEPVKLDPLFPSTGKKVAVIGSGPAGLTVARELALWGHQVTVMEKHDEPGGLMVLGIPPFRLPRDVVVREIEQVRLVGVDIQCGKDVGTDIQLADLTEVHDAVVVAAGALKPFIPDVPGSDSAGVRHGLAFLKEANAGATPQVGDNVVVIGGGFTAVDCARTALRLGAKTVKVFYRRSEQEMYITPSELEEMKHEGISFDTLVSPKEYVKEGDVLKKVRLARTRLGEPDTSGRRRPVEVEGSEFDVSADTVLLATGQYLDTACLGACSGDLLDEKGYLKTGRDTGTSLEGLFVAGDFACGADSLIDAIGHAKTCARTVDRYLMGHDRLVDVVRIADARHTGRDRAMDEIPRQAMRTEALEHRGPSDEVELGFDTDAARREAQRCYLCHYKFEIDNELCIYCDRCLKVMPVDKCIVKVSKLEHSEDGLIVGHKPSKGTRDYNLLYIDQNECIRCGACAEVCPVECITLQKVSSDTVLTGELNHALEP